MSDPYNDLQSGLQSPAYDAFAVTPADSALGTFARALYVGTGGNVSVVTVGGTTVLFSGVPSGSVLPVRCSQVRSTGTTASNIVGLV